jgi:nicotinate phosphoribosyltransferase
VPKKIFLSARRKFTKALAPGRQRCYHGTNVLSRQGAGPRTAGTKAGEKGLFFQQRQGFFAAAKYKERKLFMDEIKVVPYIPDEDYDNPAMVVDFYEFTMANCLFLHGFKNTTLVFDMFFRKNPDNMGYSISAGQRKLTRFLLNYHFNEQDIRWLRTKGMSEEFCEYLRTYKWKGDMYALPEGTVCYPHVQMVRIECDLVGAILIETYLLQTMNFHSLITTKATRVTGLNTHTPRSVMEFGTRRAQGESAGNDGAYAAVLGGCVGTANCLAEMKYGSEVKAVGTVAHSFIEFFPTEFDAFKAFADTYPDSVSLLLDTYNIMESGLPNLIKLDDYLIEKYPNDPNRRVKSARIDSGDLARGSKRLRKALDAAGKPYIKLVASNGLDERKIANMELYEHAHFDSYGVGENLITSASDPVFGGVYKLVAVKLPDGTYQPKMKCSDSASKAIIPGKKMPWRLYDENGQAQCDLIAMDGEVIEAGKPVKMVNFDPDAIERTITITPTRVKRLLVPHILNGELAIELPGIAEKKAYIAKQLTEETWETELRIEMPHKHYVNMTPAVAECRAKMYSELHGGKV